MICRAAWVRGHIDGMNWSLPQDCQLLSWTADGPGSSGGAGTRLSHADHGDKGTSPSRAPGRRHRSLVWMLSDGSGAAREVVSSKPLGDFAGCHARGGLSREKAEVALGV